MMPRALRTERPRSVHMCPACLHTHPVALSCAKAMRVAQTLRSGGPSQTRALDADDPATPAEWDACWAMVSGIRAAVHSSDKSRKAEAAGRRPMSSVGACLALQANFCSK
mgnify:CR=1 FL=1